jgi:phosphohistidine phosphatase
LIVVILYLVHHGDAVGPDVEPRRPLSERGREEVARLAAEAAARGARPAVVWHSGKLRARQTAEAFWRACNALAEFSATRDLQPGDRPEWFADRLAGETRDILIAGHYPHLPALLRLLTADGQGAADRPFPQHGVVALQSNDEGKRWNEIWRLEVGHSSPSR